MIAASIRCGYPSFQFDGGGGGGAGNRDGGHGAAGGGGTGSTTHATTTQSSASTTGGSGGGSTTCHVLQDAADCGPRERCTIVDATTGTTGCVAVVTPSLAPYDACLGGDANCPAGTWCDRRTFVCMPFCQSAADCGGNDCVAAHNPAGNTVPGGISVCTANCDPVSAAPCGAGATCTYDALVVGGFDCFSTMGYASGHFCMHLNDCAPGLVCAGTSCARWCHPASTTSSADCGFAACTAFTNLMPTYGGATYGYCQ